MSSRRSVANQIEEETPCTCERAASLYTQKLYNEDTESVKSEDESRDTDTRQSPHGAITDHTREQAQLAPGEGGSYNKTIYHGEWF